MRVPSGFCRDPRMRLVNDHGLGAMCSLSCNILSFKTFYEFFRLLECFSFVSGVPTVGQKMTVDWSASGYASWIPYRWKTC